jgi:hypothetical protein
MLKALSVCIQIEQPVLLVGEPGVAKTALVEALMATLCVAHETRIAALSEPTDFGGFPVPDLERGCVRYLPAQWLHSLAGQLRGERKGLFLDEFSNAPPATRSAALRGILDGRWGDLQIPRLATVAAMNPANQAESGFALSAPLSNRFVHLPWALDVSWWAGQLMAGFPTPTDCVAEVPDDWRENLPEARRLVAAFAARKVDAIQAVPKARAAQGNAWPSMRSWTVVTLLVAACTSAGVGLGPLVDGTRSIDDVLRLLVAGAVGDGPALEFLAYVSELDLPDPEAILADPSSLKFGKRDDINHTVMSSVVAATAVDYTQARWLACWAVIDAAIGAGREDLGLVAARQLGPQPPKDWDRRTYPKIGRAVKLLKEMGVMRDG